ncbi:uncharacterized protein LOC112088216 [Eutrema salsugineum]|nr:uncharacterized protein LOC112088216 [Eutrema salsugineum]
MRMLGVESKSKGKEMGHVNGQRIRDLGTKDVVFDHSFYLY